MVSEYQSYNALNQVGMAMVRGQWFFARFGGGWSFEPDGDDACRATWRYTFTVRPSGLGIVANPIGRWMLSRGIPRRTRAFAAACADPEIVAAATSA